jgi:osmotically inducible protein OsmC
VDSKTAKEQSRPTVEFSPTLNTHSILDLKRDKAQVHLDVTAKTPGAESKAFETAANNAKAGCPISRLLKAEITMDAKLEA